MQISSTAVTVGQVLEDVYCNPAGCSYRGAPGTPLPGGIFARLCAPLRCALACGTRNNLFSRLYGTTSQPSIPLRQAQGHLGQGAKVVP
jgi:hypothetical protein